MMMEMSLLCLAHSEIAELQGSVGILLHLNISFIMARNEGNASLIGAFQKTTSFPLALKAAPSSRKKTPRAEILIVQLDQSASGISTRDRRKTPA